MVEHLLVILSRHNEALFLNQIVTCDDKQIMHDNRKGKHHFSTSGSISLAAKLDNHQKKVMLYMFSTGVVRYDYPQKGKAITTEIYSPQLETVLAALPQKQSLVNRKEVVLVHNNVKPHTTRTTKEVIKILGFEVVSHPLYFLDITPRIITYLFLAMRTICGNSTSNTSAVTQFLNSRKRFFKKACLVKKI